VFFEAIKRVVDGAFQVSCLKFAGRANIYNDGPIGYQRFYIGFMAAK
jgi:hypothetical protein